MTRRAGGSGFDAMTKEAWEDLIFRDPKTALRATAAIAKEEAKAEIHQQQAAQSFYRDFFRAHPQLRADPEVVQHTLANSPDLFDMKVDDAVAELAERSYARIEHAKKFRDAERERAVYVGSPEDPEGLGPAPIAPMPQKTLSDTIRERREARRAHLSRRGGRAA